MAATDAVDAVSGLTQENLRPAARGAGRGPSRIGFYVVLVLLSLVFILPLLWMLVTSFKTTADATSTQSLGWIPNPFTSESYKPLASTTSQTPVVLWFLNSLAAATINTVLIVVTASMAAYALARVAFPGKNPLFGLTV